MSDPSDSDRRDLPDGAPEVPATRKVGGGELLHDWTAERTKPLLSNRVFTLRRDRIAQPNGGRAGDYYILECPSWVNVIATTPEEEMILVRQFRVGTRRASLEIPGGMVDRGEDPGAAAARELLEETGFAGAAPIFLGRMEPNPALFDNYTYSYLIRDCQLTQPQQLDAGEQIRVETAPVRTSGELDAIVASGAIRHALVVTGLYYYRLFREREGWV